MATVLKILCSCRDIITTALPDNFLSVSIIIPGGFPQKSVLSQVIHSFIHSFIHSEIYRLLSPSLTTLPAKFANPTDSDIHGAHNLVLSNTEFESHWKNARLFCWEKPLQFGDSYNLLRKSVGPIVWKRITKSQGEKHPTDNKTKKC
jgi:hypothetical protein